MKCGTCLREITRGAEERKRVEYRDTPDGIKVFGLNAPDGPLDKARGRIVKVLHGKCHWAVKKAAARSSGPPAA